MVDQVFIKSVGVDSWLSVGIGLDPLQGSSVFSMKIQVVATVTAARAEAAAAAAAAGVIYILSNY